MRKPVEQTALRFSRAKLVKALAEIQRRYDFHSHYNCISLVHSLRARSGKQRAYDGVGPLFDRHDRKFLRDPLEFTIFNREFEDLYFYEVYKKVSEWSPLRIGRVRLFLRHPGTCLHMHTDDSPRYHLAITSNPGSFFFFKDKGTYQIPTDGHLYKCDTTRLHTVFNAGETPRVHLIFDTIEWRFLPSHKRKKIADSSV
jgi:hypothetical protein